MKLNCFDIFVKLNLKLTAFLIILFTLPSSNTFAQGLFNESRATTVGFANWGYNYDSTLAFLKRIKKNPYIKIDSIGNSVQNRAIWMIALQDTAVNFKPQFRVTLHARTHPSERQSQWLTERIVEKLIALGEIPEILRKKVVFNIIPMYNPDGVELTIPRQNANYVDLERNWFTSPHEPEVKALKEKFTEFMNSPLPIRVALNMHGANASKGYFVFHHENGTSPLFANDQKKFISLVRANWPNEFADWDYFVSWVDGTPLLYPESWFWVTYKESVMAITVEETYVTSKYVSSIENKANAILNGLAAYLGLLTSTETLDNSLPQKFELSQNYPNPFNPETTIKYTLPRTEFVSIKVYDLLGREIRTLVNQEKQAGMHSLIFLRNELASGVYIYQMIAGRFSQTKKFVLLK